MSNVNWSPELEGRCPKPTKEQVDAQKTRNQERLSRALHEEAKQCWPKTVKYFHCQITIPAEISILSFEGRTHKLKDYPVCKHDKEQCLLCEEKKIPYAKVMPLVDLDSYYSTTPTVCRDCAPKIGIKP